MDGRIDRIVDSNGWLLKIWSLLRDLARKLFSQLMDKS